LPKLPKFSPGTRFGDFGNIGTGGEDRNPPPSDPRQLHGKNAEADIGEAEREAIAIELGGMPTIYATAFARLQSQPPADVPRDRLHQCIHDAELFLDHWGCEAERLGWPAKELFGLHPIAPMARYDRMGLLWMLKGEHVVALTATEARLSGGLRFSRAPRAVVFDGSSGQDR
jgi:hypothetical protein